MCGIAGYSSGAEVKDLKRVSHLLRHRGPDNLGFFEDKANGIGLVHTRLSILDPSIMGHQPMEIDNGHIVLVFNGEIYNYRELRSQLEAEGEVFRGGSDTEVLLRLYFRHGRDSSDIGSLLQQLNGIFAFALWDVDRGEMLLARDAFGVKPLYIAESPDYLAFSSEIKALIPLIDQPLELDFVALDRYLTHLWCPGEGTPVRNVRKLGPGEALWVRHGKIRDRLRWYQLPAFRHVMQGQSLSEKEVISSTASHLRQAVHRQMVSDVPVGAFLSGGLDSSAVVSFAKELNPNIHCFTIEQTGGAEAGMADDLPYARRVANYLNVPLEVISIDATRMAEDLEVMVSQLDEPLADPAPLNVLYISQLARENGMKVLLSGVGGDDLFTGYRRHRAVMAEHCWTWLPRPIRKGLESLTTGLDQRQILGRRLRKLFNGAALDADARLVNYFAWSSRKDLLALYTPEFRAVLSDAEATSPMIEFLEGMPDTVTPLDRMLALEQRYFLTDHNLTYTDKMSMAAGVEVRVPFLDLDLVEFAALIPDRFKQHGSESKWVLKKAMEPFLPHDVIYRTKSGFGAPLRRWMRHELRELLGDYLLSDSLQKRGLFNPIAVQKLILDNDSGRVDASYTLLSLLCIEIWCRQFLDHQFNYQKIYGSNS